MVFFQVFDSNKWNLYIYFFREKKNGVKVGQATQCPKMTNFDAFGLKMGTFGLNMDKFGIKMGKFGLKMAIVGVKKYASKSNIFGHCA